MENPQTNPILLNIKRGPIDRKARELILNPEFISFDANGTVPLMFEKSNIVSYRFGVKWIRGFEFTVGREYQLFLKDCDNKVMKIHFKSFYGIKLKEQHQIYATILEKLWEFYFYDLADHYFQQFLNGEEFNIGEVSFTADEIKIKRAGLISKEMVAIPWDKVQFRDYQTYFAIYHADHASKDHQTLSYLADWNTWVLHIVIKAILAHLAEVKAEVVLNEEIEARIIEFPVPSTAAILAYQVLKTNLDKFVVDWAVEMLLAGYDTEHLVILAGISAPYNQFELQSLTVKALQELQLDYSNKDFVLKNYIAYLVATINFQQFNVHAVLKILSQLRDLCIELDYENSYMKLYLLYYGVEELYDHGVQFYVNGMDKSNVEVVIKDTLSEYTGEKLS